MGPITLGPVTQAVRTHTSRSGILLAAVVLAAMLLGLSAGTAAAQDDDYPPVVITVGTPNAVITITGTNWGPDTTVTVTYVDAEGASASATAAVEADGTFAAQLALPADAALGHAEATISGTGADGQPRQDAARVFVQEEVTGGTGDSTSVALGSPGSTAGAALAAGSGAASGAGTVVPATNLPTTGGMNLGLTAFAVALLVAGAGVLVVARRRQGSG